MVQNPRDRNHLGGLGKQEGQEPEEPDLIVDSWTREFGEGDVEDKVIETLTQVIDFKPHFGEATGGPQVSARMPPELIRNIDTVLIHPGIPWATRSDFLRDAAYYMLKALVRMHDFRDPRLTDVLALESLKADAAGARYRQELLHMAAVSMRETLLDLAMRGEWGGAMIYLRRFWEQASRMSPELAESHLNLIREIPICRLVAWRMRDWPDKIPDEFIPEEEPLYSSAVLESDTGIPRAPREEKRRVGPGRRPTGRLSDYE